MDTSNPLLSEKTCSSSASKITPRIILHGGAGNLSRSTLNPSTLAAYRQSLLTILSSAQEKLCSPGATALDIATEAVTQLENNPLFNAGTGAVFTTAGTHELEASVMVSRGFRKRGVGVMGVTRARNPILLAREVLVRAESQGNECGREDSAQGHSQLHGRTCDRFVEEWGLQSARPSYFFGWKSWAQHRKGMGLSVSREEFEEAKRKADKEAGWSEDDDEEQIEGVDGKDVESVGVDETSWSSSYRVDARLADDGEDEFVPQGTVGCVVLDATGTLCAATSTGGMTNKLPGRIGDTPTLGAGFWAEEWTSTHDLPVEESEAEDEQSWSKSPWMSLPSSILKDCLPGLSSEYFPLPTRPAPKQTMLHRPHRRVRAVAMSGTGNGDSFLRVNAVRTAAAMARWASPAPSSTGPTYSPGGRREAYTSLQAAVTAVAGPGGVLEQSAEDRWESGEGQGGIIGIELDDGVGKVVFDYNCGGMFHAWVDDRGEKRFAVFQDEK